MIYNEEVQKALADGFTLDQIRQFAVSEYNAAIAEGFDRNETRKALKEMYGMTTGTTKEDVDDATWLASLMFQPAEPESEQKKVTTQKTQGFADALLAGYENSVTGLAIRGKTPGMELSPDADFWDKVAYNGAQMLGDIPAMAVGAFFGGSAGAAAGAATGPGAAVTAALGAGAGAGFVPGFIRGALMRSYAEGKSIDADGFFADLVENVKAGMVSGLEGAAIGVTATAAGKLASPFIGPMAAKVAAPGTLTNAAVSTGATVAVDAAALTAAGSAMAGQMPTAEDFALNAVICGGFKIGTSYSERGVKEKLQAQSGSWQPVNPNAYLRKFAEHYAFSGEAPIGVTRRTITDPGLKERVAAVNQPIAEAEKVTIENYYAPLRAEDLKARGLDTPEGLGRERTEAEKAAQIDRTQYANQWLSSSRYDVKQQAKAATEKQHKVTLSDDTADRLVTGVAIEKGSIYYDIDKISDSDKAKIINEFDAVPGGREELVRINPNYLNSAGNVNRNEVVTTAKKIFNNPTARFADYLTYKEYDLNDARRIFGRDFKGTPEDIAYQTTGQPQTITIGATGLRRNYSGGKQVYIFRGQRITDPIPEAKPESNYSKAVNAITDKLSIDEKTPRSLREKWDNLIYHLSDSMQGFNLGTFKGKVSDAYVAAQAALGAAGKALHIIDYGMLNGKGDIVGESLKSIMKDFAKGKGDHRELAAFLTALHDAPLHARGIGTGNKADNVKAMLDPSINPRYDFYKGIADRLISYERGLLNYARESGILSKANYDKLMTQYKAGVPLETLAEAYEPVIRGLTGTTIDKIDAFLGYGEKRTAAQKKVYIDPVESLIRQTFTLTKLASQNEAKRLACETFGMSGKVAKGGEKVQYFYTTPSGQVESRSAVVPKEVGQAIKAMTVGQAKMYNVAMSWLGQTTNIFRVGTTGNPVFASVNVIRDQIVAWVQSPKDVKFKPFISAFQGGCEIVKTKLTGKESMYTQWMRDGGAMSSMVALTRDYTQNTIHELQRVPVKNCLSEPWKYKKDLKRLVSPFTWIKGTWNGIQDMVEFSDQATRVGVYMKAREAGYSGQESAVISRRSTVDFARAGATIQSLNSIIAFLNARVQGATRVVETYNADPVTFMSKIMQGIIIPSTLLALVKHDFINSHTDPNDPEYAIADELREIPDWEKMAYWHIPISPLGAVIRIPKPQELGILAAFPESFITWASQKDSNYAMSYLETLQDQGFVSGIYDTLLPNVLPTPMVAPAEALTNYSFFTKQPIIPSHLSTVMPQMQYKSGTSTTARWLSEKIAQLCPFVPGRAQSPMVIDHLIRGWTGTLGQSAVATMDKILESTGVYDRPVVAKKVSDLPFFKTFVVKYPKIGSDSILKFNAEASELQSRYNTIIEGSKSPDIHMQALAASIIQSGNFANLTRLRTAMSTMTKALNQIEWMEDVEPEVKLQRQEEITLDMIKLAREGRKLIKQIKEAANASRQ